jgi:hypothetical protein
MRTLPIILIISFFNFRQISVFISKEEQVASTSGQVVPEASCKFSVSNEETDAVIVIVRLVFRVAGTTD